VNGEGNGDEDRCDRRYNGVGVRLLGGGWICNIGICGIVVDTLFVDNM
jgi:hypothetical protein